MTDRPADGSFEARLAERLRDYADEGIGDFDALQIAAAASASRRPRGSSWWRTAARGPAGASMSGTPALRLVLLAGLLAGLLAAGGAIAGSILRERDALPAMPRLLSFDDLPALVLTSADVPEGFDG